MAKKNLNLLIFGFIGITSLLPNAYSTQGDPGGLNTGFAPDYFDQVRAQKGIPLPGTSPSAVTLGGDPGTQNPTPVPGIQNPYDLQTLIGQLLSSGACPDIACATREANRIICEQNAIAGGQSIRSCRLPQTQQKKNSKLLRNLASNVISPFASLQGSSNIRLPVDQWSAYDGARIGILPNKDFPGSDLGAPISLSAADPGDCAQRCAVNRDCKGFVYVDPVGQTPAKCWLKSVTPSGSFVDNANTVLGIITEGRTAANAQGANWSEKTCVASEGTRGVGYGADYFCRVTPGANCTGTANYVTTVNVCVYPAASRPFNGYGASNGWPTCSSIDFGVGVGNTAVRDKCFQYGLRDSTADVIENANRQDLQQASQYQEAKNWTDLVGGKCKNDGNGQNSWCSVATKNPTTKACTSGYYPVGGSSNPYCLQRPASRSFTDSEWSSLSSCSNAPYKGDGNDSMPSRCNSTYGVTRQGQDYSTNVAQAADAITSTHYAVASTDLSSNQNRCRNWHNQNHFTWCELALKDVNSGSCPATYTAVGDRRNPYCIRMPAVQSFTTAEWEAIKGCGSFAFSDIGGENVRDTCQNRFGMDPGMRR